MNELSKQISRIIGYVLPVVLISATLTPFIFIPDMFFPYITGKAFYFRILVQIAALLYVVWAFVDTSVRPRLTAVSVAVLAFLGVLSIATLTAVDPLKSFWSNYERMEGLILFIHLVAYFFIIGSVYTFKSNWWKWFFNMSLIVSIFVGTDAFIDFYSQDVVSGYRIYGNLGNSSYLGVYSLIHIFISLFFILKLIGTKTMRALTQEGVWVSVAFYSVIGLFNLVVMFNTGTRGSFVGLVLGIFVSALLIALFERKNIRIRIIGIVLIAVSVFSVVLLGATKHTAFVKGSDVLSRFAELITPHPMQVLENQGKARSLLWGMAWQGVKERPVFGWGLDNFHYVFAQHYDPKMYGQEQWFDRSHNVFMDWLTQAGFTGLIAYLSLFGGTAYILLRKRNLLRLVSRPLSHDESKKHQHQHHGNAAGASGHTHVYGELSITEVAVLIGGLVAYLGHNLFVFDNLSSYVLFFSILAFVHQYAIRNTIYEVEKAKDRFVAVSDTYIIAVACGAVCVFGLAFYQFNMKPIAANNTLIDALRPSMRDPRTGAINTNTPKNKFELMQKSIAYGSMTNGEQIEQLAERGVELINSSATTPEEKRSAHQYVSDQYITLFGRTPEDPRPYFFYAMYLQRIGLVQESMQVAEKIVSLSPNKQSFLNFYAMLLLQNNRQEEGLELSKKAYELDTTNTNGKYMYLAALVQNRKTVEAELEAREDMRAYVTNQYVGEAYIQSMQSNRLIELIKGGISVYPTDIDLRSQLASVYVKTEQYQLAINTLQEIKEIAPQYAQTIDQAILEIQTESGIKK